MSLIEIARLTDAHRAQLGTYAQRWSQLRSSSAACDRAAAEAGVARAYQAVGLPAPRVVWSAGPWQMANAWMRERSSAGDNVRARVVDHVSRRAEAAIDRAVGLAVRVALAAEPRLTRVAGFCTSIDEAVHRDCSRVRPALRTRLGHLLSVRQRAQSLSFAAGSFSFHTAAALGTLEYFHDVCGLQGQTEALGGLWQIAENAAWMLPHERTCWLAERPQFVQHDERGRLHCAKGPAVGYGDGWTAYAWKGVLVPRWIIERPELINVRAVGAAIDPQVRRCMIEILTPERFIAEGGAYRAQQDETGILWRQRWRWEAWAAVEVVNGTPEPDGKCKHYFLQVPANMRSAREAVAWTYGLPEQRYRPVVRT